MDAHHDRQESAAAPRWTEQERKRLASKLGAQRKALGLTQSQVADRSDVATRTIGNIERGETVPQGEVLKRLLIALDMFDDGGSDFEIETRTWLASLGRLIEKVRPDVRAPLMVETTTRIASAITEPALSDLDEMIPPSSLALAAMEHDYDAEAEGNQEEP